MHFLKKHLRLLTGILVAGVVGIGGVAVFLQNQKPPADTFKDEYALTFRSYDGADVSLSQFKKKVLVAHTWASWCTFCTEELKNLSRIKEVYGDEIEVVAINRAEPLGDARAFTDSLALSPGVVLLLDPADSFFKHIEGYHMPETVFIDRSGVIVFHQRGPLSFDDAVQKINELMAAK